MGLPRCPEKEISIVLKPSSEAMALGLTWTLVVKHCQSNKRWTLGDIVRLQDSACQGIAHKVEDRVGDLIRATDK